MHLSAMACMDDCIRTYMDKGRHYDVLDFGSYINRGQTLHHRMLLDGYDCSVTGVDIQAGPNVDRVMTQPYRIPLPSRSQDVVISGQVFEHVPFPFASMLEIARVLRTGGHLFMTVPSRGHRHSTYDLWRFYPDSMRALAAYAELELLVSHTDWPPRQGKRHDYQAIDSRRHYWGDTTAVMRKPRWRPSPFRTLHLLVERRHANSIGDLSSVPVPPGPRPTPAQRLRRQGRLARRLDRRAATHEAEQSR